MSQLFFGVEKNTIRVGVACALSLAAASVLAFTPQYTSIKYSYVKVLPVGKVQTAKAVIKDEPESKVYRTALPTENTGSSSSTKRSPAKRESFITNAFLLGRFITNDSQLAQLQMQPASSDFKAKLWLDNISQSQSQKRQVGSNLISTNHTVHCWLKVALVIMA